MNSQEITQQWLTFQKQSFESFQSIWQLTQTQASNTVDRLLDQSFVPQESRKLIESWRLLMKKEGERFTAFMDRGFSIYEEMLDASQASSTTKTSKTKE